MRKPPDRSTVHAVEIHERLRAWLIATMPYEAPDVIAFALMYEVASILATHAETERDAITMIRRASAIAEEQIVRMGVGAPHP